MFFAVDEEGGTVTRVSSYSSFRDNKFDSPQDIYNQGGIDAIISDSEEKSNLLRSIGINMNLAPVADMPTDTSSFIYKRSLGRGVEETSNYIAEVVKKMNADGMISCIKHFPGYGDNVDTHTGIAIDERDYSVFEENDFKPFISGINNNAPVILVNHNIVNCMDSELPASLSKNVHKILRDNLNFSGLIITDDLAMDAVKKYTSDGNAAVQAIIAGNDLIISSDFINQKKEILNAIDEGIISEEQINDAVRRVLACKIAYKIIDN